jgi:hypothetical protein
MARIIYMKDLGATKQFLGSEIHRDTNHGKVCISQYKYVENMLLRFCINNVKLVNIPLASHFKLYSGLCPSNKEENNYIYHVSYLSVVCILV